MLLLLLLARRVSAKEPFQTLDCDVFGYCGAGPGASLPTSCRFARCKLCKECGGPGGRPCPTDTSQIASCQVCVARGASYPPLTHA